MTFKPKLHILAIRTGSVLNNPEPICQNVNMKPANIVPLPDWEKLSPQDQCGSCRQAITRERIRDAKLSDG